MQVCRYRRNHEEGGRDAPPPPMTGDPATAVCPTPHVFLRQPKRVKSSREDEGERSPTGVQRSVKWVVRAVCLFRSTNAETTGNDIAKSFFLWTTHTAWQLDTERSAAFREAVENRAERNRSFIQALLPRASHTPTGPLAELSCLLS